MPANAERLLCLDLWDYGLRGHHNVRWEVCYGAAVGAQVFPDARNDSFFGGHQIGGKPHIRRADRGACYPLAVAGSG